LAVLNILEMFYIVTSRLSLLLGKAQINVSYDGFLSNFRLPPPYDGTLTV